MDRITKRDERITVLLDHGFSAIDVAVNRLADYEDTGLAPEEVAALQASNQELKKEALPLLQAKIQDRLVVLPCKVTDTVYITEAIYKRGKLVEELIVSAKIDHVTIGGTTGKPVFDLCTETGNWYYSMEPEQFYLTREAAVGKGKSVCQKP